jgi:hypothetical protein
MKTRSKLYITTAVLIIVVAVFAIAYDIPVAIKETKSTISNVLHNWIGVFPFLLYGMILLVAHFWSPFKTKSNYITAMIIVSSVILVYSILSAVGILPVNSIVLIISGVTGFCVGSICWSLERKK